MKIQSQATKGWMILFENNSITGELKHDFFSWYVSTFSIFFYIFFVIMRTRCGQNSCLSSNIFYETCFILFCCNNNFENGVLLKENST